MTLLPSACPRLAGLAGRSLIFTRPGRQVGVRGAGAAGGWFRGGPEAPVLCADAHTCPWPRLAPLPRQIWVCFWLLVPSSGESCPCLLLLCLCPVHAQPRGQCLETHAESPPCPLCLHFCVAALPQVGEGGTGKVGLGSSRGGEQRPPGEGLHGWRTQAGRRLGEHQARGPPSDLSKPKFQTSCRHDSENQKERKSER